MWEVLASNWQFFLYGQYPHGPIGGLAATLGLSLLAVTLSFPVGLLLALCQTSGVKTLKFLAFVIVSFVRSIPLIMLIFWVFFFIPRLTGAPISGFFTMVCALTIFQGAYMAEVIRAGITALPKGQNEAARSIGMNYFQTQLFIILPQAIYNMAPSIISQLVATIKDTSLGYVISVHELTYAGAQVNSSLMVKPFQVFAIVSLGYFAICYSISSFGRYLERRIQTGRTANLVSAQ